MIVFCEECGARNIIDPENVTEKTEPLRCVECNDVLRISDSQTLKIQKDASQANESGQPAPSEDKPADTRIIVRYHDTQYEISSERPNLLMGRQRQNDIVVKDTRASRRHARIEFREGQFFLVDQSTNGTYVSIKDKKRINLKRDEVSLTGTGIIGLGRKVSAESPDAIHFNIETSASA